MVLPSNLNKIHVISPNANINNSYQKLTVQQNFLDLFAESNVPMKTIFLVDAYNDLRIRI